MPGALIAQWGGKEEPSNLLMRLLCLFTGSLGWPYGGLAKVPSESLASRSPWCLSLVILMRIGNSAEHCPMYLLRKTIFSLQMPPPVRAAVVSAVPVMPRPPMTSVVRLPPGSVIATPMPPIIHTPRINVVPMPPSAPPIMSPRPPPMIVPTGQ